MSSQILRWSEKQSAECKKKIHLFKSSNGAEGWDPYRKSHPYILVNPSMNEITKPFLSAKFGGFVRNNRMALKNYKRATAAVAASQTISENYSYSNQNKRARTVSSSSSFDDDTPPSRIHPSILHDADTTTRSTTKIQKISSSMEATIAATAQKICDSAGSRWIHEHTKKKLTNDFLLAKKRAKNDWNKAKEKADLDLKASIEKLQHHHKLTQEHLEEYYKLQIECAEQNFGIQQERIETELQESVEHQQEAKKLLDLIKEEDRRIIHVKDSVDDDSDDDGEIEDREKEEHDHNMDQHQVDLIHGR